MINSNIGILYAIDKTDNRAIDKIFNSDMITIQHEILIDEPSVLRQLNVREPIRVGGDYRIYQSEEYVFIILDKR